MLSNQGEDIVPIVPIILLLLSISAPAFSAEKCAEGYAFDPAKRECIACNRPCKTEKPGACGRGLVDCSGEAPVCVSSVNPGERMEICNGEDDDCDGTVDEGFDKDKDGYTTCSGDCDDRNATIHPDAVEKCDGSDNNCNGLIDDGFNIGRPCTAGLGACRSQGVRKCDASGSDAICDATPEPPSKEICDGIDNDCDGTVDNGFGDLICGAGACKRVVASCHNGKEQVCESGEPSAELCGDRIDNDCDGKVDEDFLELGKACFEGVGACRSEGRFECDEQKLKLVCSAKSGAPSAEVCGNGIDDDCDGTTDTDVEGLGDPCDNALLGACHKVGVLSCDAKKGALTCSAAMPEPRDEVCNSVDDDCDGAVDEGVTNECGVCGQLAAEVGSDCRVPGGDECATGKWSCNAEAKGGLECVLNAKISDGKMCSTDGNECTRDVCGGGSCGHVALENGTACDDGDACTTADACIDGACRGGAARACDDGKKCTKDSCDPNDGCISEPMGKGVENACGGCGELAYSPGAACTAGGMQGECAKGEYACQPDGTISCVQKVFAAEEKCNGLDENCNGEVDEGFGTSECGVGGCRIAVNNCEDGKLKKCVPGEPQLENCANGGVDDDCNGVIDDIAELESDCPFMMGTCIIPGKKRCLGDAHSPVCVATTPRDAEDDDGDGVANYCDSLATEKTAGAGSEAKSASGGIAYDAAKSRAVMIPFLDVYSTALVSPEKPEQAILLVSGANQASGGILAIKPADITGGKKIEPMSCSALEGDVPRHMFAVGTIAELIGATENSYIRLPAIVSQIPSSMMKGYSCRLKSEQVLSGGERTWGKDDACKVTKIAAMALTSKDPVEFAGAVVCKSDGKGFWKKAANGVGVDFVKAAGGGGYESSFAAFVRGTGEPSGISVVPLGLKKGDAIAVTATVDGDHYIGICRNSSEAGASCTHREIDDAESPIAYAVRDPFEANAVDMFAADGTFFRASVDMAKGEIDVMKMGALPTRIDEGTGGVYLFPNAVGERRMFMYGAGDHIGAANLTRVKGGGIAFNIDKDVRLTPESSEDEVYPSARFAFSNPHALSSIPMKGYGGSDLFAVFDIVDGGKGVGEVGFIYWNLNEAPVGGFSDVEFDGKGGRAILDFRDASGDPLKYEAAIRAAHGGSLDRWLDGIRSGAVMFTAREKENTVGIWPIEIVVKATDPGGLSATSTAVIERDGSIQSISNSSGQ